jgi:hypothetical protein
MFTICSILPVGKKLWAEFIMSMELWILSDSQLNSVAEWQTAVDAEGYPLRLSSDMEFEKLRGILPMRLCGELTGFECYHDDPAELMSANPDVNFGREWKYALGFRWLGSKMSELRAAWMAATAYAQATGGIVIDDQELKIHTAPEAREVVREVERDF